MSPRPEQLRAWLQEFISSQLPGRRVEVGPLTRMPGGASRESWAVDVELDTGETTERLALVLRRDPGPSRIQTDRRVEFHVLRAAREAGVPVPRVYWLGEDAEAGGTRFFLMERVEGETLGRRLLRDPEYEQARALLPAQLGRALAKIHAIDWQSLPVPLPGADRAETSPAAEQVEQYGQLYDLVAPEPHPAIEIALRWLRDHQPPPSERRLVHGDYRIGNVIFGPEGLRAVLDWELAHAGDPMEDLGWLCVRSWRFGNDQLPVGGVGRREELFAAYEAAGGGPVDPRRVRFWEVFGNLKWAVICIGQTRTYLDGHADDVELAALGRRTAEVEWELLELTEDCG